MENMYVLRNINNTFGPGTQSHHQTDGNTQKHRGNRCLVLISVGLGLICVILLVFIILLYITITAETVLTKSYKNTVEEFSQTIKSLQDNHTDLMTEKHQLQNNFNSLSQKNLETRVNDLIAEKKKLQISIESLSQKKLELETELRKLSGRGNNMLFMSTELKSWPDSRQYCRDRGAHLLIINTEEKQRFISSLVKERVWIGLSDRNKEGKMEWVDYSPLTQGFWDSKEPNNADGNEDCIELNPAKSVLNNWNDIQCTHSRKWICEN